MKQSEAFDREVFLRELKKLQALAKDSSAEWFIRQTILHLDDVMKHFKPPKNTARPHTNGYQY